MNELLERRRMLMRALEESDPYLLQPFTITYNVSGKFAVYNTNDDTPSYLTSLYVKINDGLWILGVFYPDELVYLFNNLDHINLNSGDLLQIKATGAWAEDSSNRFYISSSSTSSYNCTLSGNIMSLLYGDNFVGASIVPNYGLYSVFANSGSGEYFLRNCTDISNLKMPATHVGISGYSLLFTGASKISSAPELPATSIENGAYSAMFRDCTNLIKGPDILPATLLLLGCYTNMFYGCTSLTTAPALPATTLANNCYRQMFFNCDSLTTAPVLPAETLVTNCYYRMFYSCSKLNYIKAMFTTTPSTSYCNTWVTGVASSGTFVKNSAASWNVTGTSGVPSGWTVQTSSS